MDVIAEAAEALEELTDEGILVQQGWYDKNVNGLHITLWNLGDYPGNFSDDMEESETATVQVNIWSKKDQVKLKKRIKKLMKKAGFIFLGANDSLDTETKIYTNAARYMLHEEIEQEDEEDE